MYHLDVDFLDITDIQALGEKVRRQLFCSLMIIDADGLSSGYKNIQAAAKALKTKLVLLDSNLYSPYKWTEDLTFQQKTIILSGRCPVSS